MDQVNQAAQVVSNGGVIVYPTEAVYGLGCDPFCEQACQRIAQIKQRSNKAGFIIIIGNLMQLNLLVAPLRQLDYQQVKSSWPGHVSWILPAKNGLPKWLLASDNTVCIRYTAHPVARQLCNLAGPLISTSANKSGSDGADDFNKVKEFFVDKVEFYLDLPLGKELQASTIKTLSGQVVR